VETIGVEFAVAVEGRDDRPMTAPFEFKCEGKIRVQIPQRTEGREDNAFTESR
jgi:hypothetical protein